MGLLTKTVTVKWNGANRKWFESKGYIFTKSGDEFKAKVEELSHGSRVKVEVCCDGCNKEIQKEWGEYKKVVLDDGIYYCQSCKLKFVTNPKIKNIKLKNGKSFEQWCIENNRLDALERFDYELNGCLPSDVNCKTKKMFWFKCDKHIEHESELKRISDFIRGYEGSLSCNACNSIGQYLLDAYGSDGLIKYWNYEKNNEVGLDPFKISKSSAKKVYFNCQEKDYHVYLAQCCGFILGNRCPYCSNKNGKVHPKDSLGQYVVDNFGKEFLNKIWSDKNKKSPFEYSPKSMQYVYWKCPDNKHEDYLRVVRDSNKADFRCPSCSFSKGEKKVEDWFIHNNYIKIEYEDYLHLSYENKTNNKYYIVQHTFEGLIGLGNGLLSYDFYLPQYNLLIEYQGEQHDRPVDFDGKGKKYAKEHFKKQQEHDRRKSFYAKNNDIELLEIWYWDYDNIEIILENKLNNNKNKER